MKRNQLYFRTGCLNGDVEDKNVSAHLMESPWRMKYIHTNREWTNEYIDGCGYFWKEGLILF